MDCLYSIFPLSGANFQKISPAACIKLGGKMEGDNRKRDC